MNALLVVMIVLLPHSRLAASTPHVVIPGFRTIEACERAKPAMEAAFAARRLGPDSEMVSAAARCIAMEAE